MISEWRVDFEIEKAKISERNGGESLEKSGNNEEKRRRRGWRVQECKK
jgi:hypothetical protein